ncbi:hypothetical protein RD792_005030 [Penstemon davidsonii]|uniref:Uncharacterized protein n=1 Tax=Penstemon davidsonii TaxID=160366 RepID=A0ABR0DJ37_9LAMI|nr:hypothetical protein RD792_005030 [Penstemon davidsonii]
MHIYIYMQGLILLVLSVTLNGLKPAHCLNSGTNLCATPSKMQYGVLYAALALATIGVGGTRFTISTMGANQFANPKHQATYFNWYFITMYVASVISSTIIVYVEDNVSWSWGFGICIVTGLLGIVTFLAGSRYYCRDKPQGSPFTGPARVVIASFRKRKEGISDHNADYYYGDDIGVVVKGMVVAELPTNSLRFLNRAAKIAEGDILPNGSIAKPWKLCSVQQVEDLKSLIKILPLWSSSILLGTPIGIQGSLSVLQALAMDRHLTRGFQIPAGSILVFNLIATSICLALLAYVHWPTWKQLKVRKPTSLQQIGIGHVFNVASMAVSALVESKRRATTSSPISVLWLVPQLVIVGIGEAFHFPGQVGFYYVEFPASLKSMATAMIALLVGIAFYLSSVVIDVVRKGTNWLPNNIDDGRLDNVYWVLVVIGGLNFGYYLLCSWWYKCKTVGVQEKGLEE